MTRAPRMCAILLAGMFAGCEIGTEPTPSADGKVATGQAAAKHDSPDADAPRTRVAKGNLRFVEGYQKGYQQAQSEGKPMLVFFTAEWCHFCHQMANETFTNQQVVALSEQFVCILVDADAEPDVCRQFRVQGYPTIQFLSPRGVPLNRIVGKTPGHQLKIAMQAALQNVARRNTGLGSTFQR